VRGIVFADNSREGLPMRWFNIRRVDRIVERYHRQLKGKVTKRRKMVEDHIEIERDQNTIFVTDHTERPAGVDDQYSGSCLQRRRCIDRYSFRLHRWNSVVHNHEISGDSNRALTGSFKKLLRIQGGL